MNRKTVTNFLSKFVFILISGIIFSACSKSDFVELIVGIFLCCFVIYLLWPLIIIGLIFAILGGAETFRGDAGFIILIVIVIAVFGGGAVHISGWFKGD